LIIPRFPVDLATSASVKPESGWGSDSIAELTVLTQLRTSCESRSQFSSVALSAHLAVAASPSYTVRPIVLNGIEDVAARPRTGPPRDFLALPPIGEAATATRGLRLA
jgi:hypothetical protein